MLKLYVKNSQEFRTMLMRKGYTQKELSAELNITPNYLSSIINRHRTIGIKTAKKITTKFDCEIEDIFEFSSTITAG